jgi:hypothetical protein
MPASSKRSPANSRLATPSGSLAFSQRRHQGAERRAAFAAHDVVDVRDVAIGRRDGGVMAADHDPRFRQQTTHRAGQPFHAARFVAVGGETHQIGPKARQFALERRLGEAVQPQIEHPYLVLGRNRGGQIAEFQRLQTLEALEAEHGFEVGLGFDEQNPHRFVLKMGERHYSRIK